MDDHSILSEPVSAAAAAETGNSPDLLQQVEKAPAPHKDPGYWGTQWQRIKKYRYLLGFLVPAMGLLFVFSYIPMFGILFAFKGTDFSLIPREGVEHPSILGELIYRSWTFDNFVAIFQPRFFSAVANTLIINVIRLVICFPLCIILAVQLSELKHQGFAKAILIILCIPNFLSWTIVIGTWSGLFHADIGVFGKIFGNLMANPSWFKFFVIALGAWKSTGWGCILYYSAIASIDKSYYESATLEGANKLQKIWYLTIPSIMPTIALTLVLNISGMLSTGFEQIWTMMQVDPGKLTYTQEVLDTYIYEISIGQGVSDIPFPTALGIFNGLIGLILMVGGNYITSKTLKRGLW